MMHKNRRWGLAEIESAETLARMLTRNTQTLCSAFFVKGHAAYLFLNDAMSEDGAAEYGVFKKLEGGSFIQVESITFSWCNQAEARQYIDDALAGRYDACDLVGPIILVIDQPKMHKNCWLCA